LDALRKSEQERVLGNIPALRTNHGLDDIDRSRRRSGIVLAILLICVGTGAILYPYRQKLEEIVHPWIDALTTKQAAVPAATQPQTITPQAPQSSVVGTELITLKSQAPQPSAADTEMVKAAAQAPQSSTIDTEAVASEVSSSQRRLEDVNDETAEKLATGSGSAITRDVATASGHKKSQDEGVLSNAPTGLPPLSVNVVSYSEVPSRRFVMINETLYKEGQEISTGLMVDEITPNGPILRYQGNRFLMRP
ncbi:MAG: general secretion pathway protein GspB, partial [Gammaproteobacteria bacterium]|nr:general secretion pathway protein GspB [Gammaproteobacteria bacterium]